MALASEADVERALGRFLTDSEDVSLLLEEASDRVVAYLGYTPDPVPPEVTRAVARMVERVINKPTTTAADYGATGYNSSQQPLTYQEQPGGDPWLKQSIKDALKHLVRNKPVSVATGGETAPVLDDISEWSRRGR